MAYSSGADDLGTPVQNGGRHDQGNDGHDSEDEEDKDSNGNGASR